MLQPWWNGSRIATREEADAEAGSAAFVPAEAATTIGRRLSPLMQKIQNRILIVLCQKNNLGTKVREDLSAATVEVTQLTPKPHRSIVKSLLLISIQILIHHFSSSSTCFISMASSSTCLSSKPFLGGSISPNSNLRSQSSAYVPRIPKNFQIRAAGNTYGNHFRVTTYGESHGRGVGCVIDGCPPRIPLSESDVQVDLDRRRPGQSIITTPRKETDTCKIFSGIFEGLTTGTPIHLFVPSTDQKGHDYSELSLRYRPSHADATYDMKYGIRSVQGGGRSSARETIGRVASGAVAKKILKDFAGTEILSYVSQVHKVVLPEDLIDNETVTLDQIESNIVRCPDPEYAEKMIAAIDAVRVRGDSVGGVVTCIVRNCPRGIGSPVFDKLEAELAKAAMSLPATKGFQFGSGFAGTFLTGSEHNDEFYIDEHGRTRTRTNRSGGIQGGISNGEIINMRIAFKPTSTIAKEQNTVTRDKKETTLRVGGRHDPCVVPRAVPVVEAMVGLVLVDQLMAQYAQCNLFPVNSDLQEPLLPVLQPEEVPF